MNSEQMNAAQESMIEWLSHPQELGKAPVKIECTGNIELNGMTYYLFRYKKSALGRWLLGVCGGYENDEVEHCGHVFSEMEEYSEDTAAEKAAAMVEKISTYWKEQAEREENTGAFAGFVLLSDAEWNKTQLIQDLKNEWNIDAAETEEEQSEDALVFSAGEMLAAVGLMPAPVPNQEAEQNAENNYMWPEAAEAAKAHKAHLLVTVLGRNADLIERGELFVKIIAACCRQRNAAGVYTSGTVFEPQFYAELAETMKEGGLPVFNWIWFGLYRREQKVCCYTYGMNVFGKDEMEVLDAAAEPAEVREFLSNLVFYVLENDVTLNDGETIGFSAEDKHAITRSGGVSLPGTTLKIEY